MTITWSYCLYNLLRLFDNKDFKTSASLILVLYLSTYYIISTTLTLKLIMYDIGSRSSRSHELIITDLAPINSSYSWTCLINHKMLVWYCWRPANFLKKLFLLFYKENFPSKWKKKLYFEKFAGHLQYSETENKTSNIDESSGSNLIQISIIRRIYNVLIALMHNSIASWNTSRSIILHLNNETIQTDIVENFPRFHTIL
jgi:hypothetical protein